MRPYQKLTIKRIDAPEKNELDEELKWFAECFELDDDIFKELFEKGSAGLKTSNIASRTNKSRSTVLYKMNKLLDAGIAVKKGSFYYLRSKSFERSIEEVEEDVERMFKRMKEIAKNIDEQMKETEGNEIPIE
jgi:predicted transcriptional regulator